MDNKLKNYFCISLLLLLLILFHTANGQTYDITISTSSISSICQSNGQVTITVSGNDANLLTLREYIIKNASVEKKSNTPVFNNLTAGTYTVSVSGIIDEKFITRETTCVVGGAYQVPTTLKISGTDYDARGTRPTLSCVNTGRVQLQISNGILPYTVSTHRKDNNSLQKTDGFTTAQTVYSIDELGQNNYYFKVQDGCGYTTMAQEENITLAPIDFSVDNIQMQYMTYNRTAQQAYVHFALLNNVGVLRKYGYEHRNGIHAWWEYSYAYNGGAYTDWQDVPADGLVTDTLPITGYCSILDTKYSVRVRVKGCSTLYEKELGFAAPGQSVSTFIRLPGEEMKCSVDTMLWMMPPISPYFATPYQLTIALETGDVIYNGIIKDSVKVPTSKILSIKITDNDNCEVQNMLEIAPPKLPVLDWIVSNKVCEKNMIQIQYGRNVPIGTKIVLTNSPGGMFNYTAEYDYITGSWSIACDNPQYQHLISVEACGCGITIVDTVLPSGNYSWHITDSCGYDSTINRQLLFRENETWSKVSSQPCQPNYTGLQFKCDTAHRGTVVRLAKSPRQQYCFTAVYHRSSNTWTITRDSAIEGSTDTIYGQSNAIFLKDEVLLAGYYEWHITDAYMNGDTTIISGDLLFHQGELWRASYSSNPCEKNKIWITYDCGEIPDRTFVEFISIADTTRRNFTALYNAEERLWNISNPNFYGTHQVFAEGNVIRVEDDALLTGIYRWFITDPLGKDERVEIYAEFYTSEVTEHLSHTKLRTQCTETKYYPKSRIAIIKNGTDEIAYQPTEFSVIGDADGYSISGGKSRGYTNSDSVIINKPGVYIIAAQMLCEVEYDIIEYFHSEIRVLDNLGYACFLAGGGVTSESVGKQVVPIIVHIDTILAMPPYRFELRDSGNNFIEANNTGLFHTLGGIGDNFTVMISDNCNSVPQDISIIGIETDQPRKITGLSQICNGTQATLRAMLIGRGNICTYLWRGPNGFRASGREITIHNFTDEKAGTYYLDIYGLECGVLRDSIDVSPHTIRGFVMDTICEGTDYTGNKFKSLITNNLQYGHYFFADTIAATRAGDCDSIAGLYLLIRPTVKFDNIEAFICADQPELPITYTLEQSTPVTHSIWFDPNRAFSADIIDAPQGTDALSIVLPVPNDICPHYYNAELLLRNKFFCSTTLPLAITVAYPSAIMEQNWNDVIALLNKDYNGGYEFTRYQWFKNSVEIDGATRSFIYFPPMLDTTAEYAVRLTRAVDAVTLFTCPLKPTYRFLSDYPTVVSKTNAKGISLYPTAATPKSSLILNADNAGEATIWTVTGWVVSRQKFKAGVSAIIVPNEIGLYFVEIKTADGNNKMERILVK